MSLAQTCLQSVVWLLVGPVVTDLREVVAVVCCLVAKEE